jgi:hypothetical protein
MASATRRHLVTWVTVAFLGLSSGAHAQSTRPATAASAAGANAGAPDCPRLWREYRRSQACYARYRTLNGMNTEAFRVCGPDLPDPSAQCGPLRDPSSPAERRR